MECNNCKEEMVNLFDSNVDKKVLASVMEHIQQCPDCFEEFQKAEEVLSMLKPKVQPNVPFLLKHNIINQLKMEEKKMINFNSRTKKIIALAAAVTILMIIIPFVDKTNYFNDSNVRAANNFIESSIKATQSIISMVIKLKVRTEPNDNFSLVGTEFNMVEHIIYKSFETPAKWRVDKTKRVVVCDGQFQYLWIPESERALKAGLTTNFIEMFQIFLEPEKILMKEQDASQIQGSKIKMSEKDGELSMTITSNAQGNFVNDYCKNSSIEESDNRREYTFDSKTKLLKSLKIFILEGDKETLILETEKIEYNTQIEPSIFAITLPSGINWQELNQNYTSEIFRNISSKRAAELFFNGLANNDWKLIEETDDSFKSNSKKTAEFKEKAGGLKVIRIGEPFKSGDYAGEFVPYVIKLKSGEIIKHNLALRNDNPNKVWRVDGGY
jgi:outer membrane lipoprotein-sorting protein